MVKQAPKFGIRLCEAGRQSVSQMLFEGLQALTFHPEALPGPVKADDPLIKHVLELYSMPHAKSRSRLTSSVPAVVLTSRTRRGVELN